MNRRFRIMEQRRIRKEKIEAVKYNKWIEHLFGGSKLECYQKRWLDDNNK